MRPIHIANLDKARPVVILTREIVRPHMARVTIAPITSTVKGLSTEVHVTTSNGLESDSVISCDNIVTVPADTIGRLIGFLLPQQETLLAEAIRNAFDLEGM
ncbi:MAG: type II toxin-antitoxin system PemK/MazF family toxin [Aeromicrobium sp.]